jgi:hypothetical protein
MMKPEGLELVADVMKKYQIGSEDVIFMPFGGKFLPKYFPSQKLNIVPFELTEIYASKESLPMILEMHQAKTLQKDNAYEVFRDFLGTGHVGRPFATYLQERIVDAVPKERYLIVAVTSLIHSYNYDNLQYIVTDDTIYRKLSLLFMLGGKNTSDVLAMGHQRYRLVETATPGSWVIYVFRNSATGSRPES